MPKRKHTSYKKAFGEALEHHLQVRQVKQVDLARMIDVSAPLLNRAMYGTRTVQPELVEAVSNALDLSPQDTKNLYVTAAMDAGYKVSDLKIDLTPPDKKDEKAK